MNKQKHNNEGESPTSKTDSFNKSADSINKSALLQSTGIDFAKVAESCVNKAASEALIKPQAPAPTLDASATLTKAAHRLRQAGKKSLANDIEALLNAPLQAHNTGAMQIYYGSISEIEAARLRTELEALTIDRDSLSAELNKTLAASLNDEAPSVKRLELERDDFERKLAVALEANAKLAKSEAPAIKRARVEGEVESCPLQDVPEYIPTNGELDLATKAVNAELDVLLTGPTQCGKTTLAQWMAKQGGRELFTIQGGAGATYERIVAKDTLVESNGATITKRQLGVLPLAMQRGAILYVDEPNAIPSEVLFYLFSAMDYRRTITFDDGTTLKAASGFVVVMAMNEGAGYAGTSQLNSAFRARGKVIEDMTYLPAKRESKLIAERTGIDKATSDKLAEAATLLRSKLGQQGGLRTPIGTSALLACASLLKLGVELQKALQATIVNQVPSTNSNERKAVSDVIAAYFGKAAQ